MAGLVCDGDFNTASMNLTKFNDVYFPNDDFYNCNIFPEEWIEVFKSETEVFKLLKYDDKEEKYLFDNEESQEKKVQPYTPVCTQAELKKMLEPNHRSTKFSDIGTRIDNWLDKDKYSDDRRTIQAANEAKRMNRPYSNYSAFEEQQMTKAFRLKTDSRKPMTADPRRGKVSAREGSADANSAMRNQVRNYLANHQDKAIMGPPGKTIRQELFDESDVYTNLEDEYGPGKSSRMARQLPSAQDHKQFLNRKQQLISEGQ